MPDSTDRPPTPGQGRWQELSPLLDRLLDAPRAEQSMLLSDLGTRNALLVTELRALLDEFQRVEQERFLAEPLSTLPAPADPAGQTVGAYTLRSEIGRGGMGSVWLAERTDGRYEGQVAVKLLGASRLGRQGEARFRREGTILARLRHPHVAHLVDAGVSPSGQPYLVLEYVHGQRIDAYCDERRLGIDDRIRLFLDVAEAVSYAHSRLIVHRDLKPANVLVGEDGVVKLLDFGIAKLLEEDAAGGEATALTREGDLVLTPEYAAPEQLQGGPVTTSTDVYSLGVLLYVLLAGCHPTGSVALSAAERVRAIVEEEATRLSAAVSERRRSAPQLAAGAERRGLTPRRWRAALAGDLENITAKALKKEPALRYATVAALAEDLRRHLAQEPVSARPDALGYRAMKFVRRHRAAVGLGTLAAAALAASLVGTAIQARRATRQAARADEEARRAGAQRDFALLELNRMEAVSDLSAFVFSDAGPEGKPFTTRELLARATDVVRALEGDAAEARVELLLHVGELHMYHQDTQRADRLFTDAYALAAKESAPSTRARAACALADVTAMRGDLDGADRLLGEGLAALPDRPEYGVQRAKCLVSASQQALRRQDRAGGVARAEQAHAALAASGLPLVLLKLDVSLQLAEAYRLGGRPAEAAAANAAAFGQLTSLGRARTSRGVTVLNNWALNLGSLGQHLQAEGLMRRAVAIARTGSAEAGVSPVILSNLARALRELDRFAEAGRLAARARAEAVRRGDGGAAWRALVIEATAARQVGQPDRASRLLDQAEALLRRHEDPHHVTFAVLEMERALLALVRGDRGAAAAGADRAVAVAEDSGQKDEFVPRLLMRRGRIKVALGQPQGGEEDARRALALWRASLGAEALSAWIGQAQLVLAQALDALGRREEARAAAAEAVRHLEPCVGATHSATQAARRLAERLFQYPPQHADRRAS
jgi:eukaryotic-like serine/threonine-protein kinase